MKTAAQNRWDDSRAWGLVHSHGFSGELANGERPDVMGCCAEFAVSELTGLPWLERPTLAQVKTRPKLADVGDDMQVRSTDKGHGSLIMREGDPEQHRYVLGIVCGWTVDLVGWLYGFELQRPEWWGTKGKNRPPCWWGPQADLRPIETLTELYVMMVCR